MKKLPALSLLWSFVVFGMCFENLAAQDYKRHTISDSIPGYLVYSPDKLPEGKLPVLFLLDPSGDAEKALDVFKEAASRYGYLLVASERDIEGSYQENFNGVKQMMDDALARYPIDTNRLSIAGFSAGARLAIASAVIEKQFSGVIACGAAFVLNQPYTPNTNTFLFQGVIGTEDFNFREMRVASTYLKSLKVYPRIVTFRGPHAWPPPHAVAEALRNLLIQESFKGKVSLDASLKDLLFQDEWTYQQLLRQEGLWLYALEDLERMRIDFEGMRPDAFFKDEMKSIRRNKEFRKQRSSQYEIDYMEGDYANTYLTYLPEDMMSGSLQSLGYWESEIETIDSEFVKSSDPEMQDFGVRLKSLIRAVSEELCASCTPGKETYPLMFKNILHTLLAPSDEKAYLDLLPLCVRESEYGMALYYLEKLFKEGYRDAKTLNDLDGIALLRIQPEYGELLRSYGMESPY